MAVWFNEAWRVACAAVLGVALSGAAHAMPPQLFKPHWLLATERIAPASQGRVALPSAPVDLSGVRYLRDGQLLSLADFQQRGHVKSMLVLHDGKVVYEHHRWPNGPQTRHQSWSVMKQVLSVLVGRAVQQGIIGSLDEPMDRHLPALAHNGFAGVSFRQALVMSAGVRYDEEVDRVSLFKSAMAHRYTFGLAGRSLAQHVADPALTRAFTPGSRYEYASIVSQAIGMALEAAAGTRMTRLIERDIWQAIGIPDEASLLVDGEDRGLTLCCLYATPRSYALFGWLMAQDGVWQGKRLLPEGWVARSAGFADPQAWRATAVPRPAKTQDLFGFAYHWWPIEGGRDEFTALGIHGQMVYVSPRDRLVVVRLSDDYVEGAHNEEGIAAFRAIAAQLNKAP